VPFIDALDFDKGAIIGYNRCGFKYTGMAEHPPRA
jgi:hypothetical protein